MDLTFKKQGELTFFLKKKKKTIDIEIANTPLQRTIGLMFRQTMESNQGMLFVMEREEYQGFWMKNTFLSLDILYVNALLEIVTIHKNTIPFSTVSLPSAAPAKYVVEVIGGFCDQFGVKEGTKISYFLNHIGT